MTPNMTERMTETRAGDDDLDGGPLKRGITGPLLFLFILGDVLGAGIYALMGVLSEDVGGALWAPLLVALLLALLTAGSYAELVTKYPKAGGAAVFAERAFRRPMVSFLVGFSMLAAGVTSAAGLALAFAGDYLRTFVDVPAVPAAMVFLVLVAALNARGISESVKSNVVMTVVELSGLLIVIVVVAVMVGGGRGDVGRVTEFPDGATPALAVLSGAYYSFVGFETSANVIEEVRNPKRSIRPRSSAHSSRRAWSTCWSESPVPRPSRPTNWPSRRALCWPSSARRVSASRTGCSAPSPWSRSPTVRC